MLQGDDNVWPTDKLEGTDYGYIATSSAGDRVSMDTVTDSVMLPYRHEMITTALTAAKLVHSILITITHSIS